MEKEQRGITLIALVITIVVLIILATISINAIIGDNGIISRAEQARDHQANAEAHDQERTQELLNILEENAYEGSDNIDPETGWDLNKVDKITSEDGKIVPVPRGYVSSKIAGEKSVNTGFVIKEGTNGNATQGINEFVWVPVNNISDIYRDDKEYTGGQLWNFSGTTSTKMNANEGYYEPGLVRDSDELSGNLKEAGLSETATLADFEEQLQNEFNSMIESVKKYRGFYIGRYETGDLNKTKAIVQKGNSDIADQTWYVQYRLNKTIGANNNVKTSMIWGCQFDATLRWMQNDGVTTEIKNYPTNSTGKGNYSGFRIATGSNSNYAINNIYDMAGNVYEWTLEVEKEKTYNNEYRVLRGGDNESNGSASYRGGYVPAGSRTYSGSRATLYITI